MACFASDRQRRPGLRYKNKWRGFKITEPKLGRPNVITGHYGQTNLNGRCSGQPRWVCKAPREAPRFPTIQTQSLLDSTKMRSLQEGRSSQARDKEGVSNQGCNSARGCAAQFIINLNPPGFKLIGRPLALIRDLVSEERTCAVTLRDSCGGWASGIGGGGVRGVKQRVVGQVG